MIGSILSYINEHTWAQWGFVLFLFVPPMLIALVSGARGFAGLDIIIGWFALLLIIAVFVA